MANSENLRKAIWQSLLTADLNCRYWARLAARASRRDKIAKIFLGVTASSTVASWGIWEEVDILWKILSGASAVLAVALPIVNWSGSARTRTGFAAKWQSMLSSYELAWIDVADGVRSPEEVRAELSRFKALEDKIHASDTPIDPDDKLARQLQAAVLRSRGLAPASIAERRQDV